MPSVSELQERLTTLVGISARLVDTLDADELLTAIVESASALLSAEGCGLALLDGPGKELAFTTMAKRQGVERFRVPAGKGIIGWVVEHGEAVLVNDVTADPRFYAGADQKTGFRTRSVLCAPLRRGGRIVGALEAVNKTVEGGFTDDDLELLTGLAGLAAAAIERSRELTRLAAAHDALQEEVDERHALVVGKSARMQEALAVARRAADSHSTILLLGESGVGKEVVARAIHRWSPRSRGPFVAVNCVALSAELLESELFGHEKGAFTGAIATKKGKFEIAAGGTIFLDEIGDFAPGLQAKLLRVLQEREFQRVGGTRDLAADVRVIAATNRDLHQAIRDGSFREDLFYRLNVVSITIPPLRDRQDDVPVLARKFLERFAREAGRASLSIDDLTLARLSRYDWPGNVRELQNAIERAVVLSRAEALTAADFPETAESGEPLRPVAAASQANDVPLAHALELFKRDRILAALEECGGNQARAAQRLGLQQSNLSRMMKKLGLRK